MVSRAAVWVGIPPELDQARSPTPTGSSTRGVCGRLTGFRIESAAWCQAVQSGQPAIHTPRAECR